MHLLQKKNTFKINTNICDLGSKKREFLKPDRIASQIIILCIDYVSNGIIPKWHKNEIFPKWHKFHATVALEKSRTIFS